MSTEDLQEEIDELKQERDELQGELDNHSDELSNREQEGYDRAILKMEKKIEHSFNSGFKCSECKCSKLNASQSMLKAFLNYQMEQQL